MEQIHGGDVYRHPDALDFSSNMNPLGTPESVIRAGQESMTRIAHYPDVMQTNLLQELSAYENIPADRIVCGNGAAEVIFMWAEAVRPRKALIAVPTFAEYELALQNVGCVPPHEKAGPCEDRGAETNRGDADAGTDVRGTITRFALSEETGFRVTEDFLEAIRPDTDAVILCNPNNPTGLLIERDLLVRILAKCRRQHTAVLLDECFLDFCDEGGSFSMKAYLASFPELVILKAFTKRYAMAGLRLGYALCGSSVMREKMRKTVQPWNVSLPAQEAGAAALKETDYVRRAQKIVREERSFLKTGLAAIGFKVYDSRANYIFFRGPAGLASKALGRHVLIRDCSNYPGLQDGYYRAAVRTHEENLHLLDALG